MRYVADGDVATGREGSKHPSGVDELNSGAKKVELLDSPPSRTRHVGVTPDGSELSAHRETHAQPWVLRGSAGTMIAEFA